MNLFLRCWSILFLVILAVAQVRTQAPAASAPAKVADAMPVPEGFARRSAVLVEQTRMVANRVDGTVVKGSGHGLMEEAPAQVLPAIVAFVD
jgi:pimeloyl-ACP methyl ester carboxylesterase